MLGPVAVCRLVGIVAVLAHPEGPAATPETATLRGRVVPLPVVLGRVGLPADEGPIARQVVLEAEDGTIVPLLSDEASRALFADERLRNRPVEISVRRLPGLPYAQVTTLKVEHEGRLRTPEYFCEVCTIGVRFPQTCPCCGGPLELRMKPERP